MIQLPNGCSCSEMKVYPKDWKLQKASLKKDWYIFYRFYDPTYQQLSNSKSGKLIIKKGMNHFKLLSERQTETERVLSEELNNLKNQAYNPLIPTIKEQSLQLLGINPNTPFLQALEIAERNLKGTKSTKRDLKSVLNFVKTAVSEIGYEKTPIYKIGRKDLKKILILIDEIYGESNHRFNKVRSYLMMIYSELIELEVVESNPLKEITKRKTIERLRNLPGLNTRKVIDSYLFEKHYSFWIFLNIFFHSGSRITEIMMIKRRDVNLEDQTFNIIIKKGVTYKEVKKPIKNIALFYWQEACKDGLPEEYLFSVGLKPGKNPIESYQITKRWNRLIKKKLGIKEDFYSLKHLNLDQTAELLDINDSSKMASHTSTAVTKKHYAINETNRQNERLKNVNNPFV